jgi:hypothetical protein
MILGVKFSSPLSQLVVHGDLLDFGIGAFRL